MLDMFHTPSATKADVQYFVGYASVAAIQTHTWNKPRGKSMAHILLVGSGGNGSLGVIGANSLAGGGGGGGSGGQSSLLIPLHRLPDTLNLFLCGGGVAISSSYITVFGNVLGNSCLLNAGNGTSAVNAVAGAGGAAGGAGASGTLANSCLAGAGNVQFYSGQAGVIGGAAVAAGGLTVAVTGLIVTGGTGGGGLPAAATAGTTGGSFTTPTLFPLSVADAAPAVETTPAANGNPGIEGFMGLKFNYGGIGGASTHGTATTTGLVQSNGGNGAPGCGGGGTGGALTGSTAGVVGKGGPAFCIITCW